MGGALNSDERTSVKVFNPPGGKSSLNLGGYGGIEEEPQAKIGARSLRPGVHNSALKQYDKGGLQTGNRMSSNGPNNGSYHHAMNAPRGAQQQLSPQIGGSNGIKSYGFHSNGQNPTMQSLLY